MSEPNDRDREVAEQSRESHTRIARIALVAQYREECERAERARRQEQTRAKLDALIADWRTRGPAGKDVAEIYGWAADELAGALAALSEAP